MPLAVSIVIMGWLIPILRRWLAAYYYASRRGLSYCTYMPFLFWLFGGVFASRKPWYGVVIYIGWKPQLHNSRHSITQWSIAHATQSLTTPGKPQLSQLFGLRIVQLLAGIFPCRGSGNRNPVACTAFWHTQPANSLEVYVYAHNTTY